MMMIKLTPWSALIAAFLRCTGNAQSAQESVTILDYVGSKEDFSTLRVAIEATDLEHPLEEAGGYLTLFAPTNDAFASINPKYFDGEEWLSHLEAILKFHLTDGILSATLMLASSPNSIPSVQGEPLNFDRIDGGLKVFADGMPPVSVIQMNFVASNGMVHTLGGVALPVFMSQTIVDVAAGAPDVSTFVELLVMANMEEIMASADLTVFAPTNGAFDTIDENVLSSLKEDTLSLQAVLLNHVVEGVYSSFRITDGLELESVQGGNLRVNIAGKETAPSTRHFVEKKPVDFSINGVSVEPSNLLARNGIVHMLRDGVFLPGAPTSSPVSEPVQKRPNMLEYIGSKEGLTRLRDVVRAANLEHPLEEASASLTLFAPTNDAFAALDQKFLDEEQWLSHLEAILKFHITYGMMSATLMVATSPNSVPTVQGDTLNFDRIDGGLKVFADGMPPVPVIQMNFVMSNGMVHALGGVALPVFMSQTIVDVAISVSELSTFVELVVVASMEKTLISTDLTVFAPSNDAFATVDEGTLTALMKDTPSLQKLLLNHAVKGVYSSARISDNLSLNTIEGGRLLVTVPNKETASSVRHFIPREDVQFLVDGVGVGTANLLAGNGIVHLLQDGILFPSAPTVGPVEWPGEPKSSAATNVLFAISLIPALAILLH